MAIKNKMEKFMYTRLSKIAKKMGFGTAITGFAVWGYRKLKLTGDHIQNPYNDPYLAFAEKEREQGKQMFSPWRTIDFADLSIAEQYFPQIPIPDAAKLTKPNTESVIVESSNAFSCTHKPLFVAVGGPPAALVAYQKAKNGEAVLYVNNMDENETARPIWAGAANHGEPDATTEAPAYTAGHEPVKFLWNQFKYFINPPRYDSDVLHSDFPWLSLNIGDWLRNPRQWGDGLRVAWGNYQLARQYKKEREEDYFSDPILMQEMRARTRSTGDYLEDVDQELGGILRKPRGSLIISDHKGSIENDCENLKAENRTLLSLTAEEAEKRYGIRTIGYLTRGPYYAEKTHDFIFEPQFMKRIIEGITANGGEVHTNWRLTRILASNNAGNKGGILHFSEKREVGEIHHHQTYSQAHFSLGPTPFDPDPYPLISVTGVSINALVYGARFSGGPIVCGGSNHMVPLAEPQTVTITDPETGIKETKDVTFVRITAAGSVGPRDRGNNWYTYDGHHAIHVLAKVKEVLPPGAQLKVLSVTGCNRLIGQDGRQKEIELHDQNKKPIKNITVQVGAGGGGLTQMGALPQYIKNQNILFATKNLPPSTTEIKPEQRSETRQKQ